MNQNTCELGIDQTLAGRRATGRVRHWIRKIDETLALWHFRAKSRQEIEKLDDRLLRDVGMDRSEANKPFWRK